MDPKETETKSNDERQPAQRVKPRPSPRPQFETADDGDEGLKRHLARRRVIDPGDD